MIFDSLGSGYSLGFALKFLWARSSIDKDRRLKEFLARRYEARAWLYFRGRAALSEAVRLCQTESVITSGFSCYVVEEAASAASARPVFADIDKQSFNPALKQIKAVHKTEPRAGAVILQNTFGIGVEVKPILDYCRRHQLYLIEDLAHCPGSHYIDGPACGSVGDLVILSFSRDKQIDAVSGGALIVRNKKLAEAVDAPQPISGYCRHRLIDRLYPLLSVWLRSCYRHFRLLGAIWHRLFKMLGLLPLASGGPLLSSVALPSYRCGFILEQLESLEKDSLRRQSLAAIYDSTLLGLQPSPGQLPRLRYPLLLASKSIKPMLLERLQAGGFRLNEHWYDADVYPRRFKHLSAYKSGSCPVKEKIAARIVNLPLHRGLDEAAAQRLANLSAPYMNLRFKTKFDATEWEAVRTEFDPGSHNLLTSWGEAEAYKASGHQIWRLVAYRDKRPVALAVAVLISARRSRFLKIAGGPVFKETDAHLQRVVIQRLELLARRAGCAFIRMQPCLLNTSANCHFMTELGFKPAPVNLNAPHTLKIDLNLPATDLLSSRHYKNTRNNINQAKRAKLEVVEDNTPQALEEFLRLLELTQQSQDFVANSTAFIKAQFEAYHKYQKAHLYLVRAPQVPEVLAAALIIDDGVEAAYLYGASSEPGQKLRAAYLLQWQIILEAQQRGLKTYNLWGVAPPDAGDNHRFAGLTRFKKKFGGTRYSYLPSHDLVLSRLFYLPSYLLDKYEVKKRHL